MSERYAPPRAGRTRPDVHVYDPDGPEPWPGQDPPCSCGLPKGNALHDPEQVAALAAQAHEAQAEQRRRLGERDD